MAEENNNKELFNAPLLTQNVEKSFDYPLYHTALEKPIEEIEKLENEPIIEFIVDARIEELRYEIKKREYELLNLLRSFISYYYLKYEPENYSKYQEIENKYNILNVEDLAEASNFLNFMLNDLHVIYSQIVDKDNFDEIKTDDTELNILFSRIIQLKIEIEKQYKQIERYVFLRSQFSRTFQKMLHQFILFYKLYPKMIRHGNLDDFELAVERYILSTAIGSLSRGIYELDLEEIAGSLFVEFNNLALLNETSLSKQGFSWFMLKSTPFAPNQSQNIQLPAQPPQLQQNQPERKGLLDALFGKK